ncbi:MAG: hypothetical protein GY810_32335 [Aureispira sp.]|nr:hypothetical protein [Aureispira sp.]
MNNVTYAHVTDEELLNRILLEGDNPLAVELANRFEQILKDTDNLCNNCDMRDCDYCDVSDELTIADNKIVRLETELARK